jgi:hypothetical protein
MTPPSSQHRAEQILSGERLFRYRAIAQLRFLQAPVPTRTRPLHRLPLSRKHRSPPLADTGRRRAACAGVRGKTPTLSASDLQLHAAAAARHHQ